MPPQKTGAIDGEKALALLGKEGPIARHIPRFELRREQAGMLQSVVEAFNEDKIALIEAGTGTGKSIAYLIPAICWALESKERTLISTNTITLQEQLLHKDIPHLLKALGSDLKAVLVKGMGNYLCLRKLYEANQELSFFPDEEKEELLQIEKWAASTDSGDRSDLPFKPKPQSWEKASAESDTCTKERCPHYKKCFFFKARNRARDANILVSNHSLLFADLAVRAESEKGVGILPDYHKVILDEAHNIEDIATDYFANKASSLMVMRTLGRLHAEKRGLYYGKIPHLYRVVIKYFGHEPPGSLAATLKKLKVDLPALKLELIKETFETFGAFAEFIELIHPMAPASDDPDGEGRRENKLRILKQHHSHASWKEELLPRQEKLLLSLKSFIQSIYNLESDLKSIDCEKFNEESQGVRTEIIALAGRLEQVEITLKHFIDKEIPKNRVRWVEVTKYRGQNYVELIDAHLDISEMLSKNLFRKFPTTILTSATLATNGHFGFIRRRLGLFPDLLMGKPVIEKIYHSPFDYERQALLAVPTDLPLPSEPLFSIEAARKVYLAIKRCNGNAFVLFTSYSMMRYFHSLLKKPLEELRFPLLMQGETTRKKLLDDFVEKERSVLLGTDSFWEGVDVAGDALRCVIIVKLPFQVPNEPIIQARMEAIKEEGGNPFMDYSIPNAIVKFKQGFGRLIRKSRDRGCILCLDSRLIAKPYGQLFFNSLPNCQKLFIDSPRLFPFMENFYKETSHLTK